MAAAMRQCSLRVAFSQSYEHRKLISRGPVARLGSASHSVLEAVGAGALDNTPPHEWDSRLHELWHIAVSEEATDADQSIGDRGLGPPQKWPYYNLRYAQEIGRASCRE